MQDPSVSSNTSSDENRKVWVKCIGQIPSEDVILYYFENKRRSGGGDIKEMSLHNEKNAAEIIFENVEDAIAVSKRDHIISGKPLEVSLCKVEQTRPLYKDRVVIKGVKEEISDECLIYFLDAKVGIKTKYLAYHKKNITIVLVTSFSPIDFDGLKGGDKPFILEGATLSFTPVELTDCIYVENLPADITDDFVEIYFDHAKRSNGGPIRNLNLSAEKRTCIVRFEDYAVVDSVLEKKHVLGGNTLEVQKYFECVHLVESEIGNISLPKPIVIQIQNEILRQKVIACKEKLEKKMKNCHAKIDWSKLDAEEATLELTCTTDPATILSNRLSNRWRLKAQQTFDIVLNKIDVQEKQLKNSDVGIFLETLKSVSSKTDVKFDYGKDKKTVTIIGNSLHVDLISKYIDLSNEPHEPVNRNTKLRLEFSCSAEISMIQKLQEFLTMKMDFPTVKIHVNTDECIMDLEGSFGEVNSAKSQLCDMKSKLVTVVSDSLPCLSAKLHQHTQTKEFISEELVTKCLIATWNVSAQRLRICCPSKENLDKTVDTIKSAVVQYFCKPPDSTSSTLSNVWAGKLNQWYQVYPGRVIASPEDLSNASQEIIVCATADISSKLREEIDEIFAAISEKNKEQIHSLGSEEETRPCDNMLLVSNLPATLTEEHTKHYFEHKSQCTENVLDVFVISNNKLAIVKFKNESAMEYVLRSKHIFCGHHLNVERYKELIMVDGIDIFIVKFLTKSKECQLDIERKLFDYHSKMILSEESSSVILVSTLCKEEMMTNWEELARKQFEECLTSFSSITIEVAENIWEKAVASDTLSLENLLVSAFFFKGKHVVTLSGKREHVITAYKLVQDTIPRKERHLYPLGMEYVQKDDEILRASNMGLYRRAQFLVDQLTKQTFKTTVIQMQDLSINSETDLRGVCGLIYEKAISVQNNSVVFANLCRCLAMMRAPSDSKSGEMVNLRALILTHCQWEFDKIFGVKWLLEKLEMKQILRVHSNISHSEKGYALGNIRFIGELFKLKMLTENAMHDCVFKLLIARGEVGLEGTCILLTTTGKELDVKKAKPRIDQYFQQMLKLMKNQETPSRIKVLLQDVIDLRLNKWVPLETKASTSRT